jgi:hypothetical protein
MFGGDIDKLIPKINEIPPQNPWFSIGSILSIQSTVFILGPDIGYSVFGCFRRMGLSHFRMASIGIYWHLHTGLTWHDPHCSLGATSSGPASAESWRGTESCKGSVFRPTLSSGFNSPKHYFLTRTLQKTAIIKLRVGALANGIVTSNI